MSKKFMILNGPNINMTGIREKAVYGTQTYADLCRMVQSEGERLGVETECVQSNSEGALIDALQRAFFDGFSGVIFNPGGYTHTSVALHDAIAAIPIPVIEVHISNIAARDDFRHTSLTAAAAKAQISGLGFQGYTLALQFLQANY